MKLALIKERLTKTPPPPTFLESLQKLLERPQPPYDIKIGTIFNALAGRGYPALIVIFSLPFCLPVTIPGFSTPFGIILALIGLRIALGRHPWWPKWILEKSLSGHHADVIIEKTITTVKWLQRFVRPRLVFLASYPILHRMHGVLIFMLSSLLALPLPIPFTNMLSSIPILCIGIGLLEDDGMSIIVGYLLALICFGVFVGLFMFGNQLWTANA